MCAVLLLTTWTRPTIDTHTSQVLPANGGAQQISPLPWVHELAHMREHVLYYGDVFDDQAPEDIWAEWATVEAAFPGQYLHLLNACCRRYMLLIIVSEVWPEADRQQRHRMCGFHEDPSIGCFD